MKKPTKDNLPKAQEIARSLRIGEIREYCGRFVEIYSIEIPDDRLPIVWGRLPSGRIEPIVDLLQLGDPPPKLVRSRSGSGDLYWLIRAEGDRVLVRDEGSEFWMDDRIFDAATWDIALLVGDRVRFWDFMEAGSDRAEEFEGEIVRTSGWRIEVQCSDRLHWIYPCQILESPLKCNIRFLPTNSDAGLAFEEKFCDRCERQREFDEKGGEGCPILIKALTGESPRQWIRTGEGATCTAFVRRARRNPRKYSKRKRNPSGWIEFQSRVKTKGGAYEYFYYRWQEFDSENQLIRTPCRRVRRRELLQRLIDSNLSVAEILERASEWQ